MIRKCDEKDYDRLMRYLKQEPVYHTFLIGDIDRYGFDKDYQTVYMQESKGVCHGIFLKYYHNFIVAGDEDAIDFCQVSPLITEEITTVMGKAGLVEGLCGGLKRGYSIEKKAMYVIEKKMGREGDDEAAKTVRIASLTDMDRIYDFLMGIPELKPLYATKAMIRNRIQSGEGVHVVLEKDGKIVAHGNTAASADRTVMIGGIGVSPPWRRMGYGSMIMERLCMEIQKNHKIPCVFAGEAAARLMCEKLGFAQYGCWGTVQIEETI